MGVEPTGDPVLTLHEAADALGVHYMTAYRYVRLGQLDAAKVAGEWRVTRATVDSFRSARSDAPPSRHRSAPWHDRLEARLLAGDAAGAWGVVETAMASGAEIPEVYLGVITPALRSIGDRWERGEIDIAIEHRASGIVSRLIGRLGPRCARRGRSRGTVVLGAPSGERHGLGVAMLADLLRLEGWEVSDLGADTPSASFALAARSIDDLAAVGVSVTHPDALGAAAEVCAAIRDAGVTAPVLIGGQAICDADHARRLGADAYVADSAGLIAELDRLAGTVV